MATLAQVLNLSESSQDILATFQGHDIRVHRHFYRLPEETMQVAKVSKLLYCINNGTIARFKRLDFNYITCDVDGMHINLICSVSNIRMHTKPSI